MGISILITGAASGLGAAFSKAYAGRADVKLVLLDITANAVNASVHQVDITSEQSLAVFAKQMQGEPIDLVLHCAGVRGLVPHVEEIYPADVAACETLGVMDVATLYRAYSINALGTFLLLRTILPNLQLSKKPTVVVMSSRMGSVGNNEKSKKASGSAYAYRASKAAMNTMVRSFAVDIPTVAFMLCHPGRVETNLVRCKEEGAISAEESVSNMLPLIDSWGLENSGKFYDRFGQVIEW